MFRALLGFFKERVDKGQFLIAAILADLMVLTVVFTLAVPWVSAKEDKLQSEIKDLKKKERALDMTLTITNTNQANLTKVIDKLDKTIERLREKIN